MEQNADQCGDNDPVANDAEGMRQGRDGDRRSDHRNRRGVAHQGDGHVDAVFLLRYAVAPGAARLAAEGLQDFDAVAVVVHVARRLVGVADHLAGRQDHGDPRVARSAQFLAEGVDVVRPALRQEFLDRLAA